MDKITKEIEEMAEKMEKSVTDPKEKLQAVIKSLGKEGLKAKMAELSDEDKLVLKACLEEMTLQKAVAFDDVYAAKMIQGKVIDTVIQEDIASDDADEKLVKPEANKMNHQGTPTDGWTGQVIKAISEDESQLDLVIEKAMEKCKDDKMVMKKLKEKGMDEGKVQGALDKYKMKKDGMKKSVETEVVAKALPEKSNPEVNQVGDAPDLEGGKTMAKKTAAPELEANAKANKKNMTKSVAWEDEQRLLKANTQGRNFHFNVEQFVEQTLANEPKEVIAKAQTEGKEDLNDLIAKGKDMPWGKIKGDKDKEDAEKKKNGKMVKSFSDEELAEAMGMTVEQMNKILS